MAFPIVLSFILKTIVPDVKALEVSLSTTLAVSVSDVEYPDTLLTVILVGLCVTVNVLLDEYDLFR